MKMMLFFVLFPLMAFAESSCESLKDDCEYYTCISQIKNCSSSSYPMNFGSKYCLRYAERESRFSDQGKAWIHNVKKCLIREMEQFEQGLSCSGLKKRAFESHVPCYIENGFCDLKKNDQIQVINTIWPSIANVETLNSGVQVLKQCRGN